MLALLLGVCRRFDIDTLLDRVLQVVGTLGYTPYTMEAPMERAVISVRLEFRDTLKVAATIRGETLTDYCQRKLLPIIRADVQEAVLASGAQVEKLLTPNE